MMEIRIYGHEDGEKVRAIRAIREKFGLGLKEAKLATEGAVYRAEADAATVNDLREAGVRLTVGNRPTLGEALWTALEAAVTDRDAGTVYEVSRIIMARED